MGFDFETYPRLEKPCYRFFQIARPTVVSHEQPNFKGHSTLLHELLAKPLKATHARVLNHVTSLGLLGSALTNKRYPQRGFSAGACFKY